RAPRGLLEYRAPRRRHESQSPHRESRACVDLCPAVLGLFSSRRGEIADDGVAPRGGALGPPCRGRELVWAGRPRSAPTRHYNAFLGGIGGLRACRKAPIAAPDGYSDSRAAG